MHENEISGKIVDCSYKIHSTLGPGLLESVYEEIICYELERNKIKYERQKAVPVKYENIFMEMGFRADLIVENKIIVELKSVESVIPIHKKQLLTYLKLTNLKLGLLINFNVNLIKDGITRIANNLRLLSFAALRLCEKLIFFKISIKPFADFSVKSAKVN